MAKAQEIKFRKYECYYLAFRNNNAWDVVAAIDIHYNFYDHSNYYTVGEKQFNYLKDAKEYVKQIANS